MAERPGPALPPPAPAGPAPPSPRGPEDAAALGGGEGAAGPGGAPVQQHVRGPLYIYPEPAVRLGVDGGHELSGGVEGQVGPPGLLLLSLFLSSPSLAAATTRAPSVGSPWRRGPPPATPGGRRCTGTPPAGPPAGGPPAGNPNLLDGHPVLSEGTRLVRADHPGAPQGLHSGSFFTMAPRRAIRPTPRARTMVTMAGSPRGWRPPPERRR